jgi:lipopolysaccharide export system permease protein
MLRQFMLLFIGAFCICLFVLMMQFVWRFIDDLIGKGLSMEVLAQFFWYMALMLVPQALPLAILLASLITMGNLGESMELTAIKAAGIPLIKCVRSLICFSILVGGISFIFQNDIGPAASSKLRQLMFAMRQKSPELEIPEGIFYNGIPNVNLYVKHKEAATGMLYNLIIYKMDQGFENAQIVVADSGRLETTADKHFLKFTVYSGEQFENLRTTTGQLQANINVPYDRETFKKKDLLIDFDSDVDLLDENMFSTMAKAKNLKELNRGADSLKTVADSVGRNYYKNYYDHYISQTDLTKSDSIKAEKDARKTKTDISKIFAELSAEKKLEAVRKAKQETEQIKTDLEWEKPLTSSGYLDVRKHKIEWHNKFALSLACLFFFFIGAPLGAIIRKGGLGFPTVISVIIFITYYIINTSGMKLAREESVDVWLGMWISTIVLAPFGAFITYKANKDSTVFNLDNYINAVRRFFGIRRGRMFNRKEVIIEEPDHEAELKTLEGIVERCREYIKTEHLPYAPNYIKLWFRPVRSDEVSDISHDLEECLANLSNSRNVKVLTYMSNYPEMYATAHLSPFRKRGINIAVGVLFPIGLILAWRIWRFRIMLYHDMRQIEKTTEQLKQCI